MIGEEGAPSYGVMGNKFASNPTNRSSEMCPPIYVQAFYRWRDVLAAGRKCWY